MCIKPRSQQYVVFSSQHLAMSVANILQRVSRGRKHQFVTSWPGIHIHVTVVRSISMFLAFIATVF
jgi:hypothetical protein